MKRMVTALFCFLVFLSTAAAYNDHRGINLDSLERVVGRWMPDEIDRASEEDLLRLNRDCRDLMLGYININGEKCMYYARKALSISLPRGWEEANADAYRYIGQLFWGQEECDSALVYYSLALDAIERMASGAVSPLRPEGYSEKDVDDVRSALYGTIGNLYNIMGDVPEAIAWYEKAGAIFDKYDWKESNSTLYYNIGETWMDEGEYDKAEAAYGKALSYAETSGDSLMIVHAWQGLGRYYTEKNRPRKALPYLRKVDAYYAIHPEEGEFFRTDNLVMLEKALSLQKRHLVQGIVAGALLLVLVAIGWMVLRRKRKGSVVPEAAPQRQTVPVDFTLTEREKEVLDLIAKGYTATQIGEALHLSSETIRWYRKKLIAKFDVSNTAEMISTAKEAGLI